MQRLAVELMDLVRALIDSKALTTEDTESTEKTEKMVLTQS
jgi:hypothetical protein